ncbi:MAG TPA: hypothetical protein VGE01_05865, partial [Fimbriimonas sp.]
MSNRRKRCSIPRFRYCHALFTLIPLLSASIASAKILPLTAPSGLSGYTDSDAERFLPNGELLYYVSGNLNSGFASMACVYTGQTSVALSLGGANSSVLATNSLGDIVGRAQWADGSFHGFLRRAGTMTDLGTAGEVESEGTALNEAGIVVGYTKDAFGKKRAFRWENGTQTLLPTPLGSQSWATGINLQGDVVGVVFTGGFQYPVLWRNGALIDLAGQTGLYSATGTIHTVTDSGHVFFRATGLNDFDEFVDLPYVYDGVSAIPLTLDGASGTFAGANPDGDAIGYGRTSGGRMHAFLWSSGSFIDLTQLTGLTNASGYPELILPGTIGFRGSGYDSSLVFKDLFFVYRDGQAHAATLGGESSTAFDLSATGEAVGAAQTASGVNHAFRWSNGQTVDLGATWEGESLAYGTNTTGSAVGYYVAEDWSYRACLYQGGAIVDLGVNSSYSYAHLVNDDGISAGAYLTED